MAKAVTKAEAVAVAVAPEHEDLTPVESRLPVEQCVSLGGTCLHEFLPPGTDRHARNATDQDLPCCKGLACAAVMWTIIIVIFRMQRYSEEPFNTGHTMSYHGTTQE